MKFGIFTIYLAFIATIFSAWHYYKLAQLEAGKKSTVDYLKKLKVARIGFMMMTFFVAIASVYLWFLIFTHQFQVDYIYRYTSRDLGTGYLFSAFWAGQEGSFLFWALMIALMGAVYMFTAGRFEAWSMVIVNIVQGAFLLLLIVAGPFVVHNPAIPADGAGLNPLLQNPWMVIHPPVLFLGYAAITIPFAIGLAALIRGDFKDWVKLAIPWTLFSSITIGAGIILGAYWAYKVLGWGGYWGWDPVENSSLIAWIVVLALFHGLLVTRINGGLQKTNFLLTTISFVLVLYATFLTRSGVLADFSVHSFQDLGINAYLTIYMLAALMGGVAMVFLKTKNLSVKKINFSVISKEQIIVFTLWILLLSAFLTLIGTSSPLITKLMGDPAQVDISFYNKVNLPIAIVMSILLGIAPMLAWREEPVKDTVIKLIPSFSLSIISVIIVMYAGMSGILNIVFVATIIFALTSNFLAMVQKIKLGWRMVVAPFAHVGVALMFIGIIISGFFSTEKRAVIVKNQSSEVMGYSLTYTEDFTSPDGKDGLRIEVKDGDDTYTAEPRLYMNDYTRSYMSEPSVKEGILKDTYVSLMQKMDNNSNAAKNIMTIVKGETKEFAGYTISFENFDMSQHEAQKEFRITTILKVSKDNEVFEVRPSMTIDGDHRHPHPATLPVLEHGTKNPTVSIAGINASNGTIQLSFEGINEKSDEAEAQQIVVEVSDKPFMGILWIGTIILTLGTILAMQRRTEELKLVPKVEITSGPEIKCPKCKTTNPADAKFCRHCGKKLAGGKK